MKSTHPQNEFNWRRFASLTLFLTFVVMLVSGGILYVSPRGRVANWTGWQVLGLGKEDWASVHITSAVLLIGVAALHLFFNWNAFVRYLRSRATTGFGIRREVLAAMGATGVCFLGTVWNLPPFGQVTSFSTTMKDYWEQSSPSAPVAHAEELSLAKIADQAHLDQEELAARLTSAGYDLPDPEIPFKEIAKQNGVTPNQLFEAASIQPPRAQGERGNHHAGGGGRGYGRLTLGELCAQEDIALPEALAELERRGIRAHDGLSMRDLAGQLGMNPSDIAAFLRGGKEQANQG